MRHPLSFSGFVSYLRIAPVHVCLHACKGTLLPWRHALLIQCMSTGRQRIMWAWMRETWVMASDLSFCALYTALYTKLTQFAFNARMVRINSQIGWGLQPGDSSTVCLSWWYPRATLPNLKAYSNRAFATVARPLSGRGTVYSSTKFWTPHVLVNVLNSICVLP